MKKYMNEHEPEGILIQKKNECKCETERKYFIEDRIR